MISFRRIFLLCFLVLFLLSPSFTVQGFGSVEGDRQKIPFLPEDDLSLIRDKINANGYNFTVSSNWVVELSRERRARLRTRRYPTTPRRERSVSGLGPLAAYIDRPLPDRFDWRNVDGCSYIGFGASSR